ncbi:hypothetical protein PR003_g28333 [Phytophthora rubi]|nr:hypothetical protein PR001_g25511 [Phytophthora rubi]KAE9279073.1 hypothetical protein PR003_g28333 [Phytophthora rubi]
MNVCLVVLVMLAVVRVLLAVVVRVTRMIVYLKSTLMKRRPRLPKEADILQEAVPEKPGGVGVVRCRQVRVPISQGSELLASGPVADRNDTRLLRPSIHEASTWCIVFLWDRSL